VRCSIQPNIYVYLAAFARQPRGPSFSISILPKAGGRCLRYSNLASHTLQTRHAWATVLSYLQRPSNLPHISLGRLTPRSISGGATSVVLWNFCGSTVVQAVEICQPWASGVKISRVSLTFRTQSIPSRCLLILGRMANCRPRCTSLCQSLCQLV
jgi:hypothetical protein